jgi:hypothetical protein
MLSVAHIIQRQMIGPLVNTELEGTWKEGGGPDLRHYPGVCMEGLRKATKYSVRMECYPAVIRNSHIPNTRHNRYR